MDILELNGLERLLRALQERGYQTVGPTVVDKVIQYGAVRTLRDLPCGLTDEQGPGCYTLREREDEALFGFNLGPTSMKRFLMPPEQPLLRIRRGPQGLSFEPVETPVRPFAFIGVRGCDIAAMDRQLAVWAGAAAPNRSYEEAPPPRPLPTTSPWIMSCAVAPSTKRSCSR